MTLLSNRLGVAFSRHHDKSEALDISELLGDVGYLFLDGEYHSQTCKGYLPTIGRLYLIHENALMLHETSEEALKTAVFFKDSCIAISKLSKRRVKA